MNTPETIRSELTDRESLLQEITVRDKKIIQLDQENQPLKEQLDWFKRQIFGKRSERIVSDLNAEQLTFEGFEYPTSEKKKKKSVAAHERSKPNRDGKDKISLPDDLPVKTIMLDISEDEKICQETGQSLVHLRKLLYALAIMPVEFDLVSVLSSFFEATALKIVLKKD